MSAGTLLVTGGTGYIGSHVCVELLSRGYELVVLDSLCNSKIEVLSRIEAISGKRATFIQADVRDYPRLQDTFRKYKFEAVLHFAGLKAVGESVREPVRYYRNNIHSALTLCQVMDEFGVKRLIFSSSATVYGSGGVPPFSENAPLAPANPYGQAKQMVERILVDLAQSDPDWRICALRYFNPVGAHESGLIGEDPNGVPNNLMPFVCQVATGKLADLQIFGGDYPTPDGTGMRDYIHVVDLSWATLPRLKISTACAAWSRSTSARAAATACWKLCRPSRSQAAGKFLIRSRSAAPGMWPSATRTRPNRTICSNGGRRRAWVTCAPMPGAGSRRTPRDMAPGRKLKIKGGRGRDERDERDGVTDVTA